MGVREPTATYEPPRLHVPSAGHVGGILEERTLPSGHSIRLEGLGPDRESIELRAPSGEVQVRIVCGPEGPVVSLSAARLELEAPSVKVRCQDFALEAERSLALKSQGVLAIHSEADARLESTSEVHLKGSMLRLNCDDEAPNQSQSV